MYTLKDLRTKNIVLSTQTSNHFIIVMQALQKRGILWADGRQPLDGATIWQTYLDKTYISLRPVDGRGSITYGHIDRIQTDIKVICFYEIFLSGGQPPKGH